MSGPKNKLKIINSLNAKNISNALRTIASKKDKSCCVTYQTDGYNRNKRPEIKHINDDHYCEGSECYSIATLPSIIHNAGKAPRPYFHDQNVNKFKLEQLIQKEGLSSDFKALLEVLQKISAKPVPEYDNSQPNRRAETTPNPVQKLIDQGKHFPLTQESLENPKLPDNFKLLLEKYLKRNSQTEEEQTISKTEQLIVHLQDRKNYLENYITNISIHPSRYDHLRYKEWNHQGPELTHINKSYNNADLIDINPSNETYKNALLENLIKRLSGIPEKINPEEIISTWHKIVIEEINQEIAQIDIRIAELNKAINNHNEKGDSDIIDALSQAAIFNPGTFTIVEQSVGKDNSYYNSEEDIKASIEATNPNQSRASDTVQEENPNQPGANVRLSVESSSSSSSSDEDNTPEDETTPTSNPTTTPIQTVGTDYTIDTNDKTSIDQSKETSSNEHQEKNTSYFAATWNFISNSTASVWNSLWSILGLFKFW